MGKVIEIGICRNKGDEIINISKVEVIKGKGIVNDRKFKEGNKKDRQITIIESENILFINKLFKTNIPAINFRRNIITKNIKLNKLLNKKFFIGKIKVEAHDLCYPCKYLQDKLKQDELVNYLKNKGGLRCEILSNGIINVGDLIHD